MDLGTGYYRIVNRNSGKVLDVVGNGTADGSTHTLDWVRTAPNSNSYNATSWTGQQQYGWLVWNYAVSSLKAAGGAGTWHFIVKKDGVQVFDRTFKVQ